MTIRSGAFLLSFMAVTSAKQVCQDDPRYRFQGVDGHRNHRYDCRWIAKHDRDNNLCNWQVFEEHEDSPVPLKTTVGQRHCPVSCGQCDKAVDKTIVYSNDICYDPLTASSITIYFENENPMPRDWLGIYPISEEDGEEAYEVGSKVRDEPLLWSWLCDSDSEEGVPNVDSEDSVSTACKVSYNEIAFHSLPPGIYQVVLARWNDRVFATADNTFEVLSAEHSAEACSQRRRQLHTDSAQSVVRDCDHIEIERKKYVVGEDIVVDLHQCESNDDDDSSNAFVAIYHEETDIRDIKGDANYRAWMWTCGSQFCRGTQAAGSSTIVFGKETNQNSWPLPVGKYQAHLVKGMASGSLWMFGSVAQTSVFEIVEESPSVEVKARTLDECVDLIRTKNHCYEEGEDFQVLLGNACNLVVKDDWFGFFRVEDCSDDDHVCQGEPITWSFVCSGKNCHTSHEYKFKGLRVEHDDKDGPVLLPAGDYRVALVADKDDTGEGPYYARLLSQPIKINAKGDPCHVTQLQS